jgi:N-acyl-D-aspartate/D-glutamate deacylase
MSISTPRLVSVLMWVLTFCTPGLAKEYDILIRGGQVIDGTGSEPKKLDVGIQGDRIVAVGDLKGDTAKKVIDASKYVVTPGFIDVHSHAKAGLRTKELSAANSLLVNGVTTVIIGPDGSSSLNLQEEREELEKHGPGVNVAQMIGHGSIRAKLFGSKNLQPTERQLEEMKVYVRRAMENGAFGMSSGLFYANGRHARTSEVVELSQVVGEYGGFYTSHIRDESNYTVGVFAAVQEVITIAREAKIPGVVSHIKCLGEVVWDEAPKIVEAINKARAEGVEVYADQYPWAASQTGFSSALWPPGSLSGQALRDAIQKNLDRRGGPTKIGMNKYGGKLMSEVIGDKNPIDAVIEFKKEGVGSCVYYVMKPENKVLFMQQPWTMTCSDGGVKSLSRFSSSTHPRNFGSFARKIRKYVGEDKSITLPFAVRSMSGLAAEVCDIKDRGFIREGAFADVLVFDPNEVKDHATYKNPRVRSTGMTYVIVNGKIAIDKGVPNQAKAGVVLRHEWN